MAEVAASAVTALLGLIRHEEERLGRVSGDVQFIQEEMESMKSFLVRLARAHGEEHDEQLRTWMNQVRILAGDSNNSLTTYIYSRNPEFHRPKTGLRSYLWWVWGWGLWCLQEKKARRLVADQLRQLKERAREVGERRQRYEVALGSPRAGQATALLSATAAEDDEQKEEEEEGEGHEEGDDALWVTTTTAAPTTDEVIDYFINMRVAKWIKEEIKTTKRFEGEVKMKEDLPVEHMWKNVPVEHMVEEPKPPTPSIAFALSDTKMVAEFARRTLAEAKRHFSRSVLLDVPAKRPKDYVLQPKDILHYILWHIQKEGANAAKSQPQDPDDTDSIYLCKRKLLSEIKGDIETMGADKRIQDITKSVTDKWEDDQQLQDLVKVKKKKEQRKKIENKQLHELLQLLIKLTAAVAEEDQARTKAMRKFPALYAHIIEETAKKLKECIEKEASSKSEYLHLCPAEYQHILKDVFPLTEAPTCNRNDQIKEMIHMVKEMVQKLQDGESLTSLKSALKEAAIENIEQIHRKVREQMKIKGIMHNIQRCLLYAGERILIILKIDLKDVSIWEETRNALSLFETTGCIAGAIIVTTKTTESTRLAEEDLSAPQLDLIECSHVGIYLDKVRQQTGKHMDDDKLKIVHNILEECGQHEFCMQIFTQALIDKPKRSTEELCKLHGILQATPKSQPNIAAKVLKFSYNDLPKEHKTCLLYLAIFPPPQTSNAAAQASDKAAQASDKAAQALQAAVQASNAAAAQASNVAAAQASHAAAQASNAAAQALHAAVQASAQAIRRSTLIARWVAEELIITEDWSWSSSVTEAEKCFRSLIKRQFVRHVDIGATGRVLTCRVDPLVHGFIYKIAKKQHIVESRLSLHLARHFSIFNDVRLRGSDTIEKFLKERINDLSQVSKLKVLDLEGCPCFINKRYLKDICSKILILKYLSLKGTEVTWLPREINNLHELEVLDIRHTKIPESATRNVLLLKLKRLLAGNIDSINTGIGTAKEFSSVQIPEKIEEMQEMEVLSNVKPRVQRDLTDIGSLYQLKKLGVVISRESQLPHLLKGISDLHLCLRSLSVTFHITETPHRGTTGLELPKHLESLESLSIRGKSTQKRQLLSILITEHSQKLTKLTLSSILLEQDDLKVEVLARLSHLRCVRLRDVSYADTTHLTFDKSHFQNLNLIVDSGITTTKISFPSVSPVVEKIIINKDGVHKVPPVPVEA